VQVQVEVDKDSKEAKKAAQKSAAASTGLDAFLQQIESKKKVKIHGIAAVPLFVVPALSKAFIPSLVLACCFRAATKSLYRCQRAPDTQHGCDK
jgi:hypothetical protein